MTEEQAIAEIETMGGRCDFDEKGQLLQVTLKGPEVTDSGLKHLKGLTNFKALVLDKTRVTDAGLERLNGLTNLKGLALIRTPFTDAGLEHLKGLTNLRHLWVRETQVTEAGVKKLQEALPNCKIEY
jgi:hypothetical protein